MRIVVVSDWLAQKMGYAENILPKALAKLGHEVHLVTTDLQPDFPNYRETYEPFLGPRIQPTGTWDLDGYRLHRLKSGYQNHGVYIRGLASCLRQIKPDVVQCFTIPSYSTYQAAAGKFTIGYRLFLEEHIHKSVFIYRDTFKNRMLLRAFRVTVGWPLSRMTELCYPIAADVQEIVVKHFGYSEAKCRVCSLGVDTDIFTPPVSPELMESRKALRTKFGFSDTDVVCIYTGRFSKGKNPQCLARAVAIARGTDPRFRGLFIGAGTAEEEAEIRACDGCQIRPFVEYPFLPAHYQACDIGVWPQQESISQLDAAACGLPIIVSDRVSVKERVDGNGFFYHEADAEDLAAQLLKLADPQVRATLGSRGAQKVRDMYSWDRIARERIQDYEASMKKPVAN